MEFKDLERRIQPAAGLRREEWDRHSNGGGWVQKPATVAATTFVGPNTIVSGEARVLDFAQIIDEACVTASAVVGGHALVGGSAYVGGRAKVVGEARVIGTAEVAGFFAMVSGEVSGGTYRPLSRLDQKRWRNCPAL
jgi:UDP-3-O-[3-hydroxymyristoyl] glucosamine N-acyltransferase